VAMYYAEVHRCALQASLKPAMLLVMQAIVVVVKVLADRFCDFDDSEQR
jgi:hypothetical protein